MPISPPDPETISIGSKIAGFFATVFATGFGVFKMIDRKIEKKADADKLEEHGKSIGELFSNQRADKTEFRDLVESRSIALESKIQILADDAREDRKTIMAGINGLSEQTGKFQATMFAELTKRPTRDEIHDMVVDKIAAARLK